MKVIVAGSRTIKNYDAVINILQQSKFEITEIVSGNAYGIDKLGERYAEENNIPTKIFKADWKGLGKKAGYVRNKEMGDYADALICIWDGHSKGTKHMLDIAHDLDLPTQLVYYKEEGI